MTKGLLIAAPRSGAGKTTVTLGLLRALVKRGITVAPFKCGPDYIDPAFHRLASGRESYNLDSWTMEDTQLNAIFARGIKGADMTIAEGSMGLFDGVAKDGASGNGASADIAAQFQLPVILVLDASGQSQSAGAIALGFQQFQANVRITGVILNNIASSRHAMLARRGIERAGLCVFGALPRGAMPVLPERHLGLVLPTELEEVEGMIEKLAEALAQHCDIDAMINAAAALPPINGAPAGCIAPPGKRIALARDKAFAFVYPHVLAEWQEKDAEILPFSPLDNEAPDAAADCCWLPGGYPELHAKQLSENTHFMEGLRNFAKTKPVHGECGGYMTLGETLIDAEGNAWPMAGLLPLTTSFAKRKLHLGYRSVILEEDTIIGNKDAQIRGHEFHYASITQLGPSASLGESSDANGDALDAAGQRAGNVTGTFFHAVAANGTLR